MKYVARLVISTVAAAATIAPGLAAPLGPVSLVAAQPLPARSAAVDWSVVTVPEPDWTARQRDYADLHGLGGWSWSPPVSAEAPFGGTLNTPALEGCPAIAPDGLSLYFASNRPGGAGGLDLYVAQRTGPGSPWGTPVNLAPLNTAADEFCPAPIRDGRLLFVSARPGGCGGPDIYLTRRQPDGWAAPTNLGCGVNSVGVEASPSFVPATGELYFSSSRAGGFAPDTAATGDTDIYISMAAPDGTFGPAALASRLNTADDDSRPNISCDGREIFFDSNRPGSRNVDLWTTTRITPTAPWAGARNVTALNSAAPDLRPSLSCDLTTLYFGSPRPGGEGSSDLYVAERYVGSWR